MSVWIPSSVPAIPDTRVPCILIALVSAPAWRGAMVIRATGPSLVRRRERLLRVG